MTDKLRVLAQFPALTIAGTGLRLDKNKGKWKFSIDVSQLVVNSSWTATAGNEIAVFNSIGGNYFGVLLPVILTSPSPLTSTDIAVIGDLVGVLSVFGGVGSYTFTLTSNLGGLYSISGNQLLVAASQTLGTHPITIQADNGAGSVLHLNTTVTVTHVTVITPPPPPTLRPTYYLYGF
jgi:hypothetical protein